MKKKILYLDYSATTPLDPEVKKAMLPYLTLSYGNPSSMHSLGQEAMASVDRARFHIAAFLECSSDEIIFTSGATESNNLAIRGHVEQLGKKVHIVTSQIEHESVLETCAQLEKEGKVEVTYLPVDSNGLVSLGELERAIGPHTALVSVQYANSEMGAIQNIREMGFLLRKRKIVFHVDAVQAANFLECSVAKLNCDFLTLSAHKIYGPKGAGILYKRRGIALKPLLFGGGQEGGMRSGTEHVAAIVGMGRAVELLMQPRNNLLAITVRHLRDRLIKGMLKKARGVSLTGSLENRLPNNAHFTFSGIRGSDLVMLLDQKGIASSTGSACSERSQEPSHALLALGFSKERALSALRMTLGKYTTQEDIEKVIKILPPLLDQLQKRSID